MWLAKGQWGLDPALKAPTLPPERHVVIECAGTEDSPPGFTAHLLLLSDPVQVSKHLWASVSPFAGPLGGLDELIWVY